MTPLGVAVQSLFDAVREACSAAQWSRGIEMVRSGAVRGERARDDEVALRVATKGGVISRNVTLYLDDDTWECSCGADACEHAAAAVIAVKRAKEQGEDLPSAGGSVGRIAYRLTRVPGGLALARGVEARGAFHAFEITIAAAATRRDLIPEFHASQADLAAELSLGTLRRGVLPRGVAAKLFAALSTSDAVTLDDRPTRTSGAPVLPRAVVEDQGDGFRVILEPDADVDEILEGAIARCGEVLRPVGDPGLTAREQQDLTRGLYVPASAVGELVASILPSLERRLPVEVRSRRLPGARRLAPRIRIELSGKGASLGALATLVYGEPPVARIDGGTLVHLRGEVPIRDEAEEGRLIRTLGGRLGLAPGVPEAFEGEAAVSFVSRLDRWEGEVLGEGRERFAIRASLTPAVRLDGSRFDVVFESPAGDGRGGARRADASAVIRAWREGASMVPLSDGGWAPLPADWLSRFGHRIADLLDARESNGAVPRSLLPDLAHLCDDLDAPRPADLRGLEFLVDEFREIPTAALPADLTATLRPYQRRGVDWLVFLRDAGLGALLADDMGLGKTLQALCAIRGRTLVVGPTSVLHNWADEIRRFRPAISCSVYHGPRRKLDDSADVTVTSYALLRLDEAELTAVEWDTVILDEAQTIKNPDSQVAAAAYRLRGRCRVAMSGTPVENRLDELWSEFRFTNPGLLGGRSDFQDRYARPIADGDAAAAERLRRRIRPFLLRRLKRDVAPELPPRTDAVLYCELTESERQVYDTVRAATKDEIVRRLHEGGSVLAALEALLRLRQAACHSGLVPGQAAETSSKVELLLESLDTVLAEGHKALVFSQWTSLLDRIEPRLRDDGVSFTRLDGSTVDRAGVVAGFQSDTGPPVLLVSLKAGGTGINLTAADHVFLMDPWWNPAVEDQAADRAHRIGQERPVIVYRVVAEGTVEERILDLQSRKRAVADAALSGSAAAVSLTRDDLLELLG